MKFMIEKIILNVYILLILEIVLFVLIVLILPMNMLI